MNVSKFLLEVTSYSSKKKFLLGDLVLSVLGSNDPQHSLKFKCGGDYIYMSLIIRSVNNLVGVELI